MSGPIIRKYGFPNFDEIFGKREIQHGAPHDATAQTPEAAQKPSQPKPSEGSPSGSGETEAQKKSEDSAQL